MDDTSRWNSHAMVYLMVLGCVAVILSASVRIENYHFKAQTLKNCKAQLEATNNLIKVAMSYKDDTDKLIAVTQKHYEIDSDNLKSIMEGCYKVTRKSIGCRNQLDALNNNCNKTRIECDKAYDDLHELQIQMNITQLT